MFSTASSIGALSAIRSTPLKYLVARNFGGGFYTGLNIDNYSDSYKKQIKAASKSAILWRKIFFFCAIPAIFASMWYAHYDHSKHDHKERPKYIEYPYLNCRNKPFPWGDGNHSLFHNPKRNYVPGVGFEED